MGVKCCAHTACCMRKGEIAKMAPLQLTFPSVENFTSRRERDRGCDYGNNLDYKASDVK